MPFALALIASALVHVAALLGPAWSLPGQDETEPAVTLNAALKPTEAAPAPKPSVVAKPPAEKPPVAAPPAQVPAEPGSPLAPATEPVAQSAAAAATPAPAPVPVAQAAQPAIALPSKGRVRYVISKGESGTGMVVGQSVHTWQHDGKHYRLQSVSETTGIAALFKPARVVQTSRGEITAEGLQPTEFRHERAGGGVDSATFDWSRRVVAYLGREDALTEGSQDMLSMYYQAVLVASKFGAAGASAVEMSIATGRKLERYRFDFLGEEAVTLSSGERRALHFSSRSGSDRIDVWIAADVRGLPLKIRFIDRHGEIFDQLADDIDLRGTP